MKKLTAYALSATALCLTQIACTTPLPVAASCPPPPPAPKALLEYATPQTSLISEYDRLLNDFETELSASLQSGKPESTPPTSATTTPRP